MANVITDFFAFLGLEYIPDLTYGTLVIYQMRFAVGVALVCGVFRVIGKLAEAIASVRKW